MISTQEQAVAIQSGRYSAGKKGVAKAVRRYLRRVDPEHYKQQRDQLSITWPPKKVNK